MLEGLCSIGFVAAWLSSCQPATPVLHGYVEGEYIRLAPLEAAQIAEVKVSRGDKVNAGALLFAMKDDEVILARDSASAQVRQAVADLANIKQGRRPEEIAVIEAALSQAKAQATEAQRTYERQVALERRGVSPQASLDSARAALDAANAAVRQQQANRDVAGLGARPDEIKSAEDRVKQAEAALQSAEWRVDQRRVVAPANGVVTTIIRHAGETAGPTAPVVEMLPENAVKIVLFVPEADYVAFALGSRLALACSGCPDGLAATVSWKAEQAEFTPPVIYSTQARQKLVYLVEARPDEASRKQLRPGQIVDVSLLAGP